MRTDSNEVGTTNEKTRLEWVEAKLKSLREGSRILDAGAGEQVFRKHCKHLHYVSQDFAQYKPENVDKGLQMGIWDYGRLDIISDITDIPEKDGSFDVVLCTEVFEHIPEPLKAIKEFSRLLKQGGSLILTAPFCSMTHFAPYHYYTGFNRYFYEFHLPQAGFSIEEITYNGNYFSYLAQELRRLGAVLTKYGGSEATLPDRLAVKRLLSTLQKASEADEGSSELLSYGLHILATKS